MNDQPESQRRPQAIVQRDPTIDTGLLLGMDGSDSDFASVNFDEHAFDAGLDCGVWGRIDEAAGTIIDTHEEEWVTPERLAAVIAALRLHARDHPSCAGKPLELAALAEKAQALAVPMIFLL